jgi:hypothetical protein
VQILAWADWSLARACEYTWEKTNFTPLGERSW